MMAIPKEDIAGCFEKGKNAEIVCQLNTWKIKGVIIPLGDFFSPSCSNG